MAMPLDVVTLGECLKRSGYQTGYIGKWHLGELELFGPQKQGYDFTAVTRGSHLPGMFGGEVLKGDSRKEVLETHGQYRAEIEGDLSVEFISQNKGRPFF